MKRDLAGEPRRPALIEAPMLGELPAGPGLRLWAMLLGVIILMLTLAGPFGLFGKVGLLGRLGYYSVLVLLAFLLLTLVCRLMRRLVEGVGLFGDLVCGLLFAIAYTPVAEGVQWVLRQRWPAFEGAPAETFTRAFLCGTATLVIMRLFGSLLRQTVQAAEPAHGPEPVPDPEPAAPAAPPRLAQRIEDIGDARILRLWVKDHYVTAYLSDGREARLLMRLGDAVNEMEGVEGHMTHRSHWVTRAAVVRAGRQAGREYLLTVDGAQVPVSRFYRAELLARGLIPAGGPKEDEGL